MNWYPETREELNKVLEEYLGKPNPKKNIHGIIVPHAGYVFSGAIAGKAFSIFPKKEKAIILAPSHYVGFIGIRSIEKIQTSLGSMKITPNVYDKLEYEHSLDNQIPFLQKLGFKEVLPLVIGKINIEKAKKIAGKLSKENAIFIISTDLSHFLSYDQAIKVDKATIKAIEDLDLEKLNSNDACGFFPLLVLIELCKINNWKPKLIEYKNSGDITGDKSRVVGYASFIF